MRKLGLIYQGCMLAICAASPALAQEAAPGAAKAAQADGVADIIVTATKLGSSSIQKTPIAISAFSADALAAAHISGTRDLVQVVPSLSVAQFSTYAQIYIRGVGSNNSFNGSDPSVTVHADGVYLARPFAQFTTFLDVERVEVLRGPQGTLYGRNSAGGTINIISRVPTDQTAMRFAAEAGNYGLFNVGGYVSGALVPGKVEASIAGSYSTHKAYRKNIVASGTDVDNDDSTALRGQLRVHLTDTLEATTRGDYALAKPRIPGFSVLLTNYDPVTNPIQGDYKKVAMEYPQFSRTRIWGISEDVSLALSPQVTLKSLTAYRDSDSRSQQDGDGSDQRILEVNLGERAKQFSQEFNLVGSTGRFDYVGGLFYFDERIQTDSVVALPGRNVKSLTKPHTHTRAYAAYAQGTYRLTDALSVILGGRYSEETKDFDQLIDQRVYATDARTGLVSYSSRSKSHSFTPKAGINWSPANNILAYASVTRGFKSGGFNFNSVNPAQGFGPESLWSYEAGLKTRWWGNRLVMNLSAFQYDYKDLQVNSFISPGVTDIVNAASARVRGVELETTIRPVKALNITANLAYLDAKYLDYKQAPIGGGVVIDATGNRLNNAPKLTMNVSAQYDFDLGHEDSLFIRGEYSRRSQAFFTVLNSPIVGQSAYGLINASMGYKAPSGKWTAEIWARNLSDRQYIYNAYTSSPVPSGTPGAPRTFGARVTWHY